MAYTWSENAHEFRLTPWHNDPVTDASGEAFYLRDEDSGHVWSPTPLPAGGASAYVSRHGFGYSVFEHTEDGHPVRIVGLCRPGCAGQVLGAEGHATGRIRRVGCPRPAMWNGCSAICGPSRRMHVITEIDPTSGALFARNPYNTEFADRIAFFDVR